MKLHLFFVSILLMSVQIFSYASFQDWFRNSEQRAWQVLNHGDPAAAAKQFKNSDWKGVAYYRAHDFENALQFFSEKKDAVSLYNKGNALAHLGEFEKAIDAYENALKLKPDFKDAEFNRNLLKKLISQKQQNQNTEQQAKQQDQNQKSSEKKQTVMKNQQKSFQDNQTEQSQSSEQSLEKKISAQKESLLPAVSDLDQKQAQQESSSMPSKQNQKATAVAAFSKEAEKDKQTLNLVPDHPGSLLKQLLMQDYLNQTDTTDQ